MVMGDLGGTVGEQLLVPAPQPLVCWCRLFFCMKATTLDRSIVSWQRGLAVLAAAAAVTVWVATSPRYLHPINPVAPSLSIACIYAALAALAAITVRSSRTIAVVVWTPTMTHL